MVCFNTVLLLVIHVLVFIIVLVVWAYYIYIKIIVCKDVLMDIIKPQIIKGKLFVIFAIIVVKNVQVNLHSVLDAIQDFIYLGINV